MGSMKKVYERDVKPSIKNTRVVIEGWFKYGK